MIRLFFILFLLYSFLAETATHYSIEAQKGVKRLSHLKYQSRFERIIKLTERIEDERAKEELYFEICRTLNYFYDLKGFHQKSYLEKQTSLLHAAASAFITYQTNDKVESRRIGNPEHCSYQLTSKKKEYGFFKKRDQSNREIACWDLSHLFGCSEHIAPTIAMSFQGNYGSYQPYIQAKVHKQLFYSLSNLPKSYGDIGMLTFWKANLFALIIGHLDLVSPNIPTTKRRNLVFFDNEATFSPINHIQGSRENLFLPLVNVMMEWPQAKQKLTAKEATKLNQLVKGWREIDLDSYLNHPLTNLELREQEAAALKERIEKISNFFPFSKGQTFEDLFLYCYPDFYRGKEEILPLVEQILDRPFSPYSALVFISTCRGSYEGLSDEDNQKLLELVEKYYGDPR